MIQDQVFQAIISSSAIEDAGIPRGNWYAQAAADTITARPFGVVRWGPSGNIGIPGVSTIGTQDVEFWVYDNFADYGKINEILKAVRRLMLNLESRGNSTGWFLGVRWNGDSTYLSDETYGAIVRYASFTVTASGL